METAKKTTYTAYFDLEELARWLKKHSQHIQEDKVFICLENCMLGHGDVALSACLDLLCNLVSNQLIKVCEGSPDENSFSGITTLQKAIDGEENEHSN